MVARCVGRDVFADVYFKESPFGVNDMASATVRIRPETHDKLRKLAEKAGESMPETLDRAIDVLYRKEFLRGLAEDYARLKADPKKWVEEQKERKLWDRTLADGMEGK